MACGDGCRRQESRLQLVSLPPRVEMIDTRSPEVAPLWAELRESASALGLEGAYFLIVPSFEPGGARVAAAASARIRPLLETFGAGRNPEVDVAIRSGFSGSEPGVWRPDALLAELPLPLRRPGRRGWSGRPRPGASASTTASTCRCSRPAGGAGSSRSTHPQGPITPAFMRAVQKPTERFHRAYVRTRPQARRAQLTELEAGALRLVAEGQVLQEGRRRPRRQSPRRRRRRSSVRG